MRKSIMLAAVAVGLWAAQASAVIYTFDNVTANSVANVTTGEAQLSVDVTDAGPGKVLFTFSNSGPLASSITDVYFDDGTLLGIASIINGSGVNFSPGGSPPNLPGGNSINFHTTAGFLASLAPPVQPMGVNPGF